MRSDGDGPAAAALERAISVWFDGGLSVALAAQRPAAAAGHGDERLAAVVFGGEATHAPTRVDDPRLSTTYDGERRVAHCGLELWESEESERALRIGGEALAHGEIALPDGGRTRVAFLSAHSDGRRASAATTSQNASGAWPNAPRVVVRGSGATGPPSRGGDRPPVRGTGPPFGGRQRGRGASRA